jgi:hypothetical protein
MEAAAEAVTTAIVVTMMIVETIAADEIGKPCSNKRDYSILTSVEKSGLFVV